MQRLISWLVLWMIAGSVDALNVDDYQLVDLSHAFSHDTLYWPTAPSKFEKKQLAFGMTGGGFFYSLYIFSM